MHWQYKDVIGWNRLQSSGCITTRHDKIANIEKWSQENNLRLNRAKSAEIIFTDNRRKHAVQPPSELPGIGRVDILKILKVTVYIHCISKKRPTFKLSVILSNLNRFSKFLHCGKRMKFAAESYDIIQLTLGMFLHYIGKLRLRPQEERYSTLPSRLEQTATKRDIQWARWQSPSYLGEVVGNEAIEVAGTISEHGDRDALE